MRFLLLCSPGLFMFFGLLWMVFVVRRTPAEQRNQLDLKPFSQMSVAVGAAMLVWMAVVLLAVEVRPAFPLTIGLVGLLLLVQGLLIGRMRRR